MSFSTYIEPNHCGRPVKGGFAPICPLASSYGLRVHSKCLHLIFMPLSPRVPCIVMKHVYLCTFLLMIVHHGYALTNWNPSTCECYPEVPCAETTILTTRRLTSVSSLSITAAPPNPPLSIDQSYWNQTAASLSASKASNGARINASLSSYCVASQLAHFSSAYTDSILHSTVPSPHIELTLWIRVRRRRPHHSLSNFMPFRRTLRPGSRSGSPVPTPSPSPVTTPAATRTDPIPGPPPIRAMFIPSTDSAIEPSRPSAANLPPTPTDPLSSKPGGSAVEESVSTLGDRPSTLPGIGIPSVPSNVVVGTAPTSGAAQATAVASQIGTVASSSGGLAKSTCLEWGEVRCLYTYPPVQGPRGKGVGGRPRSFLRLCCT